MSTTKNTPATNPNAELAQGLRDLADFLDQHAELPDFSSFIGAYVYGDTARAELEAFANLRPGALESEASGQVRITHLFGPAAELYMSAPVKSVGGVKYVMTYRPILANANGGGHAA